MSATRGFHHLPQDDPPTRYKSVRSVSGSAGSTPVGRDSTAGSYSDKTLRDNGESLHLDDSSRLRPIWDSKEGVHALPQASNTSDKADLSSAHESPQPEDFDEVEHGHDSASVECMTPATEAGYSTTVLPETATASSEEEHKLGGRSEKEVVSDFVELMRQRRHHPSHFDDLLKEVDPPGTLLVVARAQ